MTLRALICYHNNGLIWLNILSYEAFHDVQLGGLLMTEAIEQLDIAAAADSQWKN